MKIGSLFAGIGGFDLAGEWCGHRTIWTSEVDPFCVSLLAERFPAARQLGDITTIDWSQVERPDILTGGFPCQDISYAGKGAGLAGKRSGLWYEYARAIRELGPDYVIVENVRALFTRGFDAVLGTLADLGYDAEWSMYGAADVGAPHRRHRVWLLAYPSGRRCDVRDPSGGGGGRKSRGRHGAELANGRAPVADATSERPREARGLRPDQPAQWATGGGQVVADATGAIGHASGAVEGRESDRLANRREALADAIGERSQGEQQAGTATGPVDGPGDGRHPAGWAVEPNVGRVAHGVPARVDRLRGLGNAIVPACALPIYGRIKELERGMK